MREIIITSFLFFISGAVMFFHFGEQVGRIQVASGEVICTLKTNKDKTSDWLCEDMKDILK